MQAQEALEPLLLSLLHTCGMCYAAACCCCCCWRRCTGGCAARPASGFCSVKKEQR